MRWAEQCVYYIKDIDRLGVEICEGAMTQPPPGARIVRGSPSRTYDLREQLQVAYTNAVAASAGCTVWTTSIDEGIDLELKYQRQSGAPASRLAVQLKTTDIAPHRGFISCKVRQERYEEYRVVDPAVPVIVVVMHVPKDQSHWVYVRDKGLTLHHCAYWVNLAGAPASESQNVTVNAPIDQPFDDLALCQIMGRIGEGGSAMSEGHLFGDDHYPNQQLSSLLEQLGWRAIEESQRLRVWTRPDVSGAEVLEGLGVSAPEERRLMRNALATLSRVHGENVVTDHISRIRKLGGGYRHFEWHQESPLPGSISVEQGVLLMDSVGAELSAAAKATQGRKPAFGRSHNHIAQSFLSECLFGPSRPGSYVVTADAPAYKVFHASKDPEANRGAYTGDQIVATLSRALTAVRAVIDNHESADDKQMFRDVVKDGVSSELLASIARSLTAEVEITVSSADSQRGRARWVFTPGERAILTVGATQLKEQTPRSETLVGFVTDLHRAPDEQGGRIALVAATAAGAKNFHIQLDAYRYELAIRAHKENLVVLAEGVVAKSGRSWELAVPDVFEVHEPKPLEPYEQSALL